jgi:hypothetical protein
MYVFKAKYKHFFKIGNLYVTKIFLFNQEF